MKKLLFVLALAIASTGALSSSVSADMKADPCDYNCSGQGGYDYSKIH